ncbi:putative phosphate ABC transporter, periplasmic phosphate-binding protein [Reticulibacter mediterranei]|uniref:Putative phosphate ABC transporter, periplasmic phosphate-binding protein n=1 Tax=Reticulibacter mediterranei TaxID=2778369 RepID=A0A8J3IKA8_9CHLR|nr:substrate-binding domain-containing protein [Reticulibacter mediterranei]GHO94003.1 putative phosphate ABC transporter, periplasmic phosphate-binding protein [Reticulibacter mediterranei]
MSTWFIITGTILLIVLTVAASFTAARYAFKFTRPKRKVPLIILSSGIIPITLIIIIASALWPRACTSWPLSGEYHCEQGAIKVGGSTALQPLLLTMEDHYIHNPKGECTEASITVLNEKSDPAVSGSRDGIDLLMNNSIQIASSDIFMEDFVGHARAQDYRNYEVAAVIYVVIVSKKGVAATDMPGNLSTGDLQKIFGRGGKRATTWGEVGGPATIPIVPFIRDANSGTQRTFQAFVLNGETSVPQAETRNSPDEMLSAIRDTIGGIGYVSLYDWMHTDQQGLQAVRINGLSAEEENIVTNTYPFWNIEHLYLTNNNADKLSQAFINYIGAPEEQATLRNYNYVPITALPTNVLDTRCQHQ